MKKYCLSLILAILIFPFSIPTGIQNTLAHAQDIPSPTPTYDPLAEPILPENPSEFDLGENWYWHHCMPCHGDKGQGLTDEFRSIWPEEHQDCWGYGCHAGVRMEDSFRVPTVVPSIINDAKLARFSSLQELYDFLKATHPPQYPGHLSDEQYSAIAAYLFSMNNRSLAESAPTPKAPTPKPTQKVVETEERETPLNPLPFFGGGLALVFLFIWGIRKYLIGRVEQSNP